MIFNHRQKLLTAKKKNHVSRFEFELFVTWYQIYLPHFLADGGGGGLFAPVATFGGGGGPARCDALGGGGCELLLPVVPTGPWKGGGSPTPLEGILLDTCPSFCADVPISGTIYCV